MIHLVLNIHILYLICSCSLSSHNGNIFIHIVMGRSVLQKATQTLGRLLRVHPSFLSSLPVPLSVLSLPSPPCFSCYYLLLSWFLTLFSFPSIFPLLASHLLHLFITPNTFFQFLLLYLAPFFSHLRLSPLLLPFNSVFFFLLTPSSFPSSYLCLLCSSGFPLPFPAL